MSPGTLFGIVGFQTKLKHGEQKRIFRMIPGLENAEFARLGGLHEYVHKLAPVAGRDCASHRTRLRFAGQITGVEGYQRRGRAARWSASPLP